MFEKLKEFFCNDVPQTEVRSLNIVLSETVNNMVYIEGGAFMMGSCSKKYTDQDTIPMHKVSLSSFKIGKFSVTQELWMAVMGENPSIHQGNYQLPVENVSWYDCMSFLNKLNKLCPVDNMVFRLPTEAEWEYAARGGQKTKGYVYPGSNNLSNVAWFSCRQTHPVGKKLPNELGLYDMSGNVLEWCSDWYDSGYYAESPENNPTGPAVGSHGKKVCRGCEFGSLNEYLQVWWRGGANPDYHNECTGLRLALSEYRQIPVNKERNTREILDSIINNMMFVEGGSYTMGDEKNPDRALPHRVLVSSFYICKYQVTQEEWEAVMNENPSYFIGGMKHPIENVSWDDCQRFITRLNDLTNMTFRLPTEAEWEYAARGGSNNRGYFISGVCNIDEVAWCHDNSRDKTHPVGQKKPNEIGLYDMIGNVKEWCSDWYDSNYYVVSREDNPCGPAVAQESQGYKVCRGDSWNSYHSSKYSSDYSLIARRDYHYKDSRNHEIGLRLVSSSMSPRPKNIKEDISEEALHENMDKLKGILLGNKNK